MIVGLDSLVSWDKSVDYHSEEESTEAKVNSPFPLNYALNKKIYLWKGDILKLIVDSVICPTKEDFKTPENLASKIIEGAGPEIELEIKRLEGKKRFQILMPI